MCVIKKRDSLWWCHLKRIKKCVHGRGRGPDEVKPALHSELIHVQSHCRPIIPCTTKLPDKSFRPSLWRTPNPVIQCQLTPKHPPSCFHSLNVMTKKSILLVSKADSESLHSSTLHHSAPLCLKFIACLFTVWQKNKKINYWKTCDAANICSESITCPCLYNVFWS